MRIQGGAECKMAVSSQNHKRFQFSESNQKIRMELRLADMKLKKEIERLEKQSYTTTNNISNHQQALKMSWRRLEQRRQHDQDSPTGNRKNRSGLSEKDSRRGLLFSNRTVLTLDSGEERNEKSTSANVHNSELSSDSLPHLQSKDDTSRIESRESTVKSSFSHASHIKASPYISSPYPFYRKTTDQKLPQIAFPSGPKHKVQQRPLILSKNAEVPFSPNFTKGNVSKVEENTTIQSDGNSSDTYLLQDDSELAKTSTVPLMPPLDATMNTRSAILKVRSKTVDKNTLLKAKELMNIDSSSQGPNSFQQFYTSSPSSSTTVLDSKIMFSDDFDEDEMMKQLTEEEQDKLIKAKEENSELTLAEMFEQIKQCRYIRHYHPFGAHSDDEDEQDTTVK